MKLVTSICCLLVLLFLGSTIANAVPIIALKRITIGSTDSSQLMRFDSTLPEFVQSETTITGLLFGEVILAIDFRPSNGKLYGLSNQGRIYQINPNTGAATLVGSGAFTQIPDVEVGFDFDPVADVIRIVTPLGQNLRVNPDTGSIVGVDNPIAFAAGDPNAGRAPGVFAAAYSNNFSGATSTTLYVFTGVDFSGSALTFATQGSPGGTPVSPNAGKLFTIANLSGFVTTRAGLDIAPDGTAYALISGPDQTGKFFTINLSTGAISQFATFGQLLRIRDLAVVLPNSEPPIGTFQFNSSSFNVAEGNHFVTVTITRTGDTSAPASIDLTTVDDSALQRSDYTIALRRIDFGAGETSKDVKILVVDDGLVEPSESFKVILSNATGGFQPGTPNSASVAIADNEISGPTVLPPPNPVNEAQFFVRQHYADFLNREPDADGLDFWTNQITSCGSNQECIEVRRIHVSAAFFFSIEFQRTAFTVYLTHRVAQLGLLAPDGLPSYVNYMRDVQALQKDVVFGAPGAASQLEANTQAFFNDVVKREEFVTLFGSLDNRNYVDFLISRTGVAFSSTEHDALIGGLDNQTETRATVLRRVVENQAFREAEFNRAFVLVEYFGYLRRNPDSAGFNFWLNKLNSFNGDFVAAEMVKAFISSQEYRSRFGLP